MQLKRKFESGEFAILAEMEPPKGVDTSRMVANARRIKDDVDAFLVPEMSNAVMRMSSLGAAMILQKQGMEAVIQVCCRDRNRLALQADLLAAFGCGIARQRPDRAGKPGNVESEFSGQGMVPAVDIGQGALPCTTWQNRECRNRIAER